ncbi:Dethiobiotin synthetase [Chitinispirillum alkaliphilum]|nr:Dethiobiotin synthetase [Chitinispirillum alkaliphilum]
MKSNAIFITGTDTDIGKTYISRLLADTFAGPQTTVSYVKPIQTGCEKDESGILRAPDADYVFRGKAVKIKEYKYHVPFRFEPACSPHLAASLESVSISLEHISHCLQLICSQTDLVVVEGAGGILVPLNEHQFMIDLMIFLQLPVILVTSPHLGTLNHTLLSLSTLRQNNLKLAGTVINNVRSEPDNFLTRDNKSVIRKHSSPSPVLEIEFGCNNNNKLKEFCNDIKEIL